MPTPHRIPIFEGYARALLEAHHEPKNFYKEAQPATQLNELGYSVPAEVALVYVKAVIISYVGNGYGHCWRAEESNKMMLQHFDIERVKALIQLLNEDRDLIAALTDQRPVARLQAALEIIASRPLLPDHEEKLAFYREAGVPKIRTAMLERLQSDRWSVI